MIYFFLGDDGKVASRIAGLKQKLLTSKEARKFDYEVLYAHKLSPSTLKKALLALPAIAPQRLILIHDCHKLSPANKKLILESASSGINPQNTPTSQIDHAVIVLESRELSGKDSFVKKIKPFVKMVDALPPRKSNVFDMTRAMGMRRQPEALRILSELFSDGIHPLQIMGGIIWYWRKTGSRLSMERYERGLRVLQEADLNIKRSRLKPDYAVEVLVVKLCGILNSSP